MNKDQLDQEYLRNKALSKKLREMRFMLRAYEKMLTDKQITEVQEELRIRRILEAYPAEVPEAMQKLKQVHTQQHKKTCKCLKRAQLSLQTKLF